jgi:hypothetical protein
MGERKDERFEAASEGNNHNIVGQGYQPSRSTGRPGLIARPFENMTDWMVLRQVERIFL